MKPLVYYCRWHGFKMRLRGRDESAVWGELVVTSKNGDEESQEFHFQLQTSELTLQKSDGALTIMLDDMGMPLRPS